MQREVKLSKLTEPAGFKGVLRFGAFFLTIVASPPSTTFSCAFNVDAAAMVAIVAINVLREVFPMRSEFSEYS